MGRPDIREFRDSARRFRKEYVEPMLGFGDYANQMVVGFYRSLTGDDVSYVNLEDLFADMPSVNKRLVAALKDAGIVAAKDVMCMTEAEFCRKARVSESAISVVSGWLESYGLSFKGEDREPWMGRGEAKERRVEEVFRNPEVVGLLRGDGIKTVGDVIESGGEERLREIKGMGNTRVIYIKEILEKLGITLNGSGGA